MINITQKLSDLLRQATEALTPPDATCDINLSIGLSCSVSACHDLRFGDYQSSAAMVLGKIRKDPPREIAQKIIARLKELPETAKYCEMIEPAGPGFINFYLKAEFITEQLQAMSQDVNNGITKSPKSSRVVIDFSGPNIAKSMHVGHIRSTFLGDSLARFFKAVGHQVITDNHLGDWGTQFGKLIYGYKHFLDWENLSRSPIAEFERLYKESNSLCEKDPVVLKSVRQELAKLQAGNPENLRIWREISEQSLIEFRKAYSRMGVSFDHELGESFYNPQLPQVVSELKQLELARESQGAICIFFEEDQNLKNAAPMIIQKADGAFLYATTDLATIQYRVNEWKSDEILYVTDARQQLHFKQLFAASRKWYDLKKQSLPRLRHITFGSVLGADKKPIKTRSGEPIKLTDLLNEAEARALKIIQEKNPKLSIEEQNEIARVIGIGALKYADLSQNRELDYVFDWNKLLALQGNTAPYLIYAYVRIQSIFAKDEIAHLLQHSAAIILTAPEEMALAKHLIQFSDTVHAVLHDYRPHILSTYLYDLAGKFSKFYEACPVLKAEEPIRSSRLSLCRLTAHILKNGLDLLGIETVEKM
jgi:arginyl-tRNA synthetase